MRRLTLSLALILLSILSARKASAADPYLEGLDALARGEFEVARKRFEEAAEKDDDAPDPHLALGVALTFLEKFDEAFAEVERADRLKPRQKPPRLWMATIVAMRGDLFEDTKWFPAATRDPFETDLREMSHRYGDPGFRAKRLREAAPDAEAVRANERALFPALARRFVEKIRPAAPELHGSLAARGIERHDKGQYAEAYADLLDAYRGNPSDLNLLFYVASCRLHLGAPEGAREALTRCLTKDARLAKAYVLRAAAHAALGDPARSEADLRVARALGSDASFIEKTMAEVQRPPAGDSPPNLRALLATPERAREFAVAFESRRKRADETYQERLRVLRDAGDPAALGGFLVENATMVLTEWVEPRSKPRPYRSQDVEAELKEAEKVLDEALAKDATNARAHAWRAACRMQRYDWDAARAELDGALSRSPKDPVILDLVAQVSDHAAAVSAAAASNLRQVKSWSDYWFIYTQWPSEAELAQAAALDREAQAWRQRAKAALAAAASEAAGTARGDLYRSRIAEGEGDVQGMRTALLEATQRDETLLPAWTKLAEVEGALGHVKEAYSAQMRAANLSHSTAAPMLKLAWIELARTAYKAVDEALSRAEDADPTDPRVAAYRGALAEARGRVEEAGPWYQVAWRLAEARASLRGLGFGAKGPRLSAEEVGLPMRLAFRVARVELARGKPDAALTALSTVLPLEDRVEVADRYVPVPSAMIAGVPREPGEVPSAPNLETIAAWVHLRAGDAFERQSKNAEALAQFDWLVDFERRKPSIADVGSEIREPVALAAAHRARVLLALGRREEARMAALSIPRRRDLPPSSQQELERVREEVEAALGGR